MRVRGFCPMGCGQTLEVAVGARVTCSSFTCPKPHAVDTILDDRETEHVVVFDEDGWSAQHPLRERLDGELFDCEVHKRLCMLDGPPVGPGRYRVKLHENDPVSESRRSDDVGLDFEAL